MDLDEEFITIARRKCENSGIRNASFVAGNAYQLPFEDNEFDAVVSYTGIGVLRDPQKAFREMIRVCREEGVISIAEAVTGRFGIQFSGMDSLQEQDGFPESVRYHELLEKIKIKLEESSISSFGNPHWTPQSLMGLFSQLGFKEIHFNAWGYGSAPDDTRVPGNKRMALRESEYKEQKNWLASLRKAHDDAAICREDIDELDVLLDARYQWIKNHAAYDWEAGVSIVVSGLNRKS